MDGRLGAAGRDAIDRKPLRRQAVARGRRQRDQLRRGAEQTEQQRGVEKASGCAEDRRSRDDEEQRGARTQRDRRPAVRARKG
jgi:hypothetical protein